MTPDDRPLCAPDRHHWTNTGPCAHCPAEPSELYDALVVALLDKVRVWGMEGGPTGASLRHAKEIRELLGVKP